MEGWRKEEGTQQTGVSYTSTYECVCKDKISQAPPGPRANTRPRLSRAG